MSKETTCTCVHVYMFPVTHKNIILENLLLFPFCQRFGASKPIFCTFTNLISVTNSFKTCYLSVDMSITLYTKCESLGSCGFSQEYFEHAF